MFNISLDDFLKTINYYEKYKQCDHGENNIYHKERYLYNHIELILTEIDKFNKKYKLKDENFYKLLAIFHDIGKVYTGFNENGKTYFRGHAYLSSLITLDYINILSKYLINDDIYDLIKIIFYHTLAHKQQEYKYLSKFDFSNRLFVFGYFDNNGRLKDTNKFKTYKIKNEYISFNNNIEKDKEVLYLYGIPGIGKTYLINNRYNKNNDYYIVSRDSIIDKYAKEFNISYNEFYKLMHSNKVLKNKVDYEFNNMMKEAKEYDKIIIDMTNIVKKHRRGFLHYYNRKEYNHNIKILLRPYSQIVEFNKNRDGKDLNNILIKLINSSTPPSYSEGFDNIEFEILTDKEGG